MPQITKEQIDQQIALLNDYFVICTPDRDLSIGAALAMFQELLDQPEGEALEYLLDGMRVKLNFNKMGNMTSLSDMEHELQGRWVCFVGAENGKHLKATHPAPFTPITADMVTDEMLKKFQEANMESCTDRHAIVDAVNAFMPSYLGAKK
jgi:hypothetical protein